MPFVSVIIPFFNDDLKYVEECLKSVKSQFYKNLEIIVVDDCSAKSSSEGLKALLDSKYPEVKYVAHDVNKGLSAARNTGVRLSKNSYITFLDSDDFLLPFSLVRRMRELLKYDNESTAGVYGKVPLFYMNTKKFEILKKALFPIQGERISFLNSAGECPFPAHAPILKKDVFDLFGGFDESLKTGAEDWDLWYRMMRNGYSFEFSSIYSGAYRQKKGSMVRNMAEKHLNVAQKIIGRNFSDANESDIVIRHKPIYRRGLPFYLEQKIVSSRAIQFLALEYLAYKKCSKLWSFTEVTAYDFPLLNIDVDKILRIALSRYNCVPVESIEEEDFIKYRNEIRGHIF